MKIRKMKVKDYDDIVSLWKTSSGITLRAIDDSKEGIKKFLKRNPDTCLVCKNKKEIIGGILCGHDGRKGFIYHAIVKYEYQNKGIGKSMVTEVIKKLKNENITKVAILVNHNNPAADIFWGKLGFIFDENIKYGLRKINEFNI